MTKAVRTLHATPMHQNIGVLKVTKAKGTVETELKKIERCPLFILDDLILVALEMKERSILLDFIEEKHGRKATVITSYYKAHPSNSP